MQNKAQNTRIMRKSTKKSAMTFQSNLSMTTLRYLLGLANSVTFETLALVEYLLDPLAQFLHALLVEEKVHLRTAPSQNLNFVERTPILRVPDPADIQEWIGFGDRLRLFRSDLHPGHDSASSETCLSVKAVPFKAIVFVIPS